MSAPGLKINSNPHYSHMKMPEPDESLRFYPKWVHMKGYPDVLAIDEEDEARLLSREPREEAPPAPKPVEVAKPVEPLPNPPKMGAAVLEPPKRTLAGPNEEREILLEIAKEKNIRVDGRWKLDRLRATIERETSK